MKKRIITLLALTVFPFTALAEEVPFTFKDAGNVVQQHLLEETALSGLMLDKVWVKNIQTRKVTTLEAMQQEASDEALVITETSANDKLTSFGMEVAAANAPEKNIYRIYGRYEPTVEVPVLVKDLPKGRMIQESDLTLTEIPQRKLRRDIATQQEAVVGKVVQRYIAAGKPIGNRAIADARVIERGGLISIIYRSANMELKTTGVALEDGAAGQTIRIRNEDSGKTVQAEVQKNGDALVKIEG